MHVHWLLLTSIGGGLILFRRLFCFWVDLAVAEFFLVLTNLKSSSLKPLFIYLRSVIYKKQRKIPLVCLFAGPPFVVWRYLRLCIVPGTFRHKYLVKSLVKSFCSWLPPCYRFPTPASSATFRSCGYQTPNLLPLGIIWLVSLTECSIPKVGWQRTDRLVLWPPKNQHCDDCCS